MHVHCSGLYANICCYPLLEYLEKPTLTPPGDVEIYENEDAIFTTVAAGKPYPHVEWYHGYKKLKPTENILIEKDGDKHTIIIKECYVEDSGTITAMASNKAGTCSAESALSVVGQRPPSTILYNRLYKLNYLAMRQLFFSFFVYVCLTDLIYRGCVISSVTAMGIGNLLSVCQNKLSNFQIYRIISLCQFLIRTNRDC